MKYGRGKHPNSRVGGFKPGNKLGFAAADDELEDGRRLWFLTNAYKRRCKRKGLDFKLTSEEFLDIVKGSCHYCGKNYKEETRLVNKRQVEMLSVDRLDSSKGYEIDNCVPCCKQCNTCKMDYSYQDFIDKVRQIAIHLNLFVAKDA